MLCVIKVAGGCPGDGSQRLERGKLQLFAFGDSYADTGNLPSSFSKSWKFPYGITFPGKPSGRFSDGRVLTDYIGMIYKSNVICYLLILHLSFHIFLIWILSVFEIHLSELVKRLEIRKTRYV